MLPSTPVLSETTQTKDGENFVFETTYSQSEGIAPTEIKTVVSDGDKETFLAMIKKEGDAGDYLAGVRYAASSTFPAGNYSWYVTALATTFERRTDTDTQNFSVENKIAFSNVTETEDDGIQDGKGVADKTVFSFSINLSGDFDEANLVYAGAFDETSLAFVPKILPLSCNQTLCAAATTLPKGRQPWHLEAKKSGIVLASTTVQMLTSGYSSVVFIPGLEASTLYDANGNRLWTPAVAPLHDNTKLLLDKNGVSIEEGIYVGDIIHKVMGISKGNVYESFANQLDGLKADGTINDWKGFPYDWRYDVRDVVNHPVPVSPVSEYSMTDRLRSLAANSDTGKVIIVSHSNGGLVAKELSNALGADASKLLDKMIFVASPQVGTPAAVGSLLHGYQTGLPADAYPVLIAPTEARNLAQNAPGVYGLLPGARYFRYVDDPVITIGEGKILDGWREKYGEVIHSDERLRNFMTDASREILPTNDTLTQPSITNADLYSRAESLHAELDNWTPPAGVEADEIAVWGEETLEGVRYYEGLDLKCASYYEVASCVSVPSLKYDPVMTEDGDGTVVAPSALWLPESTGVRKWWVDLKEYNKEHPGRASFGITPVKHASIFDETTIGDLVSRLIQNHKEVDGLRYISKNKPISDNSGSKLHFLLHSPLSLNLYDNLGNHTGYSTTTSELEENIPGSRFSTIGEVVYVSVPADTVITVILNGEANGSYTLDVEKEMNGIITKTTFAAVPSTPNTIASLIVIDGEISDLSSDTYGDGTKTFILSPKENEIVVPDLLPKKEEPKQEPIIASGGAVNPYFLTNTPKTESAEQKPDPVETPAIASVLEKATSSPIYVATTVKKIAEKTSPKKTVAIAKLSPKIQTINNKFNQTASVGAASGNWWTKFVSWLRSVW